MWRCVEERYLGLRDTMKIAKQNTGYQFTKFYLLQPLFVEEVFAERNICGTLFESPAVYSGQVVLFLICSDSDTWMSITTPLSLNKVNVIVM